MVKTVHVEGYDAAIKTIEENSKSNSLFVLFSGSKDTDGTSWCPDCVAGQKKHFVNQVHLIIYIYKYFFF